MRGLIAGCEAALLTGCALGPATGGLARLIKPESVQLYTWLVCEPTASASFEGVDRLELYCEGDAAKGLKCRGAAGVAFECRTGVRATVPPIGPVSVRTTATAGFSTNGFAGRARACVQAGYWSLCPLDREKP